MDNLSLCGWAGNTVAVASLAGQAIKAEGAEPEGRELSLAPVPSPTSLPTRNCSDLIGLIIEYLDL